MQKSVPIQPRTGNILPKFGRSAVVSPLQVPSLKVLLVGAGFAITEDETVTLGADFKEVHFGFLPLTLFFRVCQCLDSLKDSKQFARTNSFFNLPQVFSELYATVSRIVELLLFSTYKMLAQDSIPI